MSIPPFTDNSHVETTGSFVHTSESLHYAVTHVFLPVELPTESDHSLEKELSLARAVCTAAHAYTAHVDGASKSQWYCITRMLNNLEASVQLERDRITSQLCEMRTGDVLAFFSRSLNTAVILTKQENCALIESFEVSPPNDVVEKSFEPLLFSYPGFAMEIPNHVLDHRDFQCELAGFLRRQDDISSEPSPPFSPHSQSIIVQHLGILKRVGRIVNVSCVVKHIRDDVTPPTSPSDTQAPWRRSSLWLLVRVAIQMSLDRSPLGRASYKAFTLYFMCSIARDSNIAGLSSGVLHLIASKILRRMSKFGTSIPGWVSQIAFKTCADIRGILDARWTKSNTRTALFQNPSQDELIRDTELSLERSREYISDVLANCGSKHIRTSFCPSLRRRRSIDDFLSADSVVFDTDIKVTLYDIEQSVQQGLDDWISRVTQVEEACVRLEILMDKYMAQAYREYHDHPEAESILLLTGIKLFVSIDQLAVKNIPMLADYSPEIPLVFLERLFLRRMACLHHLSQVYQYIAARHSQSHPGWSVLPDEFTEDSIPVRYYDQSLYHQQLKARIEEDTVVNLDERQLEVDPRHLFAGGHISQLLFASPLNAKVAVFELQCPTCIRVWRSAVSRIWYYSCDVFKMLSPRKRSAGDCTLLSDVSGSQRYFLTCGGSLPEVGIYSAYRHRTNSIHFVIRCSVKIPRSSRISTGVYGLEIWSSKDWQSPLAPSYWLPADLSFPLKKFVEHTTHTSNDVLSTGLSPGDEFITFGHLRSGGLLQWINILHGLRSRTLNLRLHHFHFLLTNAALQVGPLDLNTGTWVWHQDLQETSFCNALLDELEDLSKDVRAELIGGLMMNTVSLLAARLLASSPSEAISKRVIALLLAVRRKTFIWVQELSYSLTIAPTNKERRDILLDMAATCRSTFLVDPATLPKLFQTAEDVDAALSSDLILTAHYPECIDDKYLKLLLERDSRLSLDLEDDLRNAIFQDPSDYGIDLAVRKVIPSHKPGPNRWSLVESPLENACWLTCRTKSTVRQPSHLVHLNLVDGEVRMDGSLSSELPRTIMDDPVCQRIFHGRGIFAVPSDLPGMEFTTIAAEFNYKVHFSLRNDALVIRLKSEQTGDVLELIPSKKLEGDLPPVLVDDHVHWLNLNTKTIEIRPLERPWERSPENWRIECRDGKYHAYKGQETLVDIHSPTWDMLSQCFRCLNVPELNSDHTCRSHTDDLLVTMLPIDSLRTAPVLQLSVTLPLYGLSFFVNAQEELESHDFKEMVFDENQCIGTLFGLENILVLRQKDHLPEGLVPRRVLIPNGYIGEDEDHRVRVTSDRKQFDISSESLQAYSVDAELGGLVGNGSLMNMQYLAQLHARTTRYSPDPLTDKTGVQTAYLLLQSAGCWSIMKRKSLDNSSSAGLTSTRYPQIGALYEDIRVRYYWDRDDYFYRETGPEERRIQRASHLIPWDAIKLTPEATEGEHLASRACTESGLSAPPSLLDLGQQYIFKEKATWPITLDSLFSSRSAPGLPSRSTLSRDSDRWRMASTDNIPKLDRLFTGTCLETNKSCLSFHQEYLIHLDSSARACVDSRTIYRLIGRNGIETLQNHFERCRETYSTALAAIKKALGPTADPLQQALHQFGQWAPVGVENLLRCLASNSPISLPPPWKTCLVSFALLILDLQRARRLLRFALDGLEEELSREIENEGCDGWNAEDYPDWLLIQIQGNFLIRRSQADVAMEIISSRSGRNTVMQVGMGEGKSSVIIPIAAASLANGKQLARVIVPKALTVQMFELLVARLGGLTHRPIYHLPFYRSPEYNDDNSIISLEIDDLQWLMSRCITEHGILLVQPQHIASLKLMCVEEQLRKGKLIVNPSSKLQKSLYRHLVSSSLLESLPECSFVGNIIRWLNQSEYKDCSSDNEDTVAHQSDEDSASKWLNLQKWMDSHIRDILDESDEVLHPRFQLMYTIGLQQHMDGYPDRWTITQQVLRLVSECAFTLARNHPHSIECRRDCPGSFPYVSCVQVSGIRGRLVSMIVEDVMAGRHPSFNFRSVSPELQYEIRCFISDESVFQVPDTAKRVEEYARSSTQSNMWIGLLLLRGLLASNILMFALMERRWRIDYGLVWQAPSGELPVIPTMLAVPYHAKDMPAPNTQFGHPDITIVLTCLSYYYGGLAKEQLRSSFEMLLDEYDAPKEYAAWVKDYDDILLPHSSRTLKDINLKSSEQWDRVIYPLFSRNQRVIDFYLSRVVFPREAMEFQWKLSASAWDLAEAREKVVTGISGTNDGRWLLPTSISQYDLEHQRGANARSLSTLLRPENDFYMALNWNGKRERTHEILATIARQQPEIRVLLDVGAQVLDFSNLHVAQAWLDITRNAAGAIYFNENDELMVLNRNGISQTIQSSPLSSQLGRCVVYLDHAHTRGTDIKLPVGSRAAVTLGPKLTKDCLVQGCMRMRKLGCGHSVVFLAPPDVDLSIRALVGKNNPNTSVTTADVLCWAIHGTWDEIQRQAPSWVQQGMTHKARSDAWSRYCKNEIALQQLSDAWLQPERKSLEDLYAPRDTRTHLGTLLVSDTRVYQRCNNLGILSVSSARLEEEQEREVNHEKEREREVELSAEAKPAIHTLHPEVIAFVKTGFIPPVHSGGAFRPIFTALEKSSAATREADVWSPFILATVDFCNTIQPESTQGTMDQYLRRVQWVLSSKMHHNPVLVVISPFEANCSMPDIRTSECVHLHIYAPRTSLCMRPSDDLKLYSIPPLPSDWTPPWALIDQLNVFSGQFYLRDYQSYLRLCQFLGVPTKDMPIKGTVPRNLFNIPGSLEEAVIMFSDSPLPFVVALLAIRNRGRPFAHTHMGKILQGKLLTVKDFEGPQEMITDVPRLQVRERSDDSASEHSTEFEVRAI